MGSTEPSVRADSRSARPESPDPRRWKALILLCVANLMIILDAQIVILAQHRVAHGYDLLRVARWRRMSNVLGAHDSTVVHPDRTQERGSKLISSSTP
jgi:hypothetical protein